MAVGTTVTVIGLLSQGRSADKLFLGFTKFSAYRIRQMLKQQKLYGYIEYSKEDECSPILFTSKGFLRATKRQLRQFHDLKWDHLWRVISFDIPEKTGCRKKFQRQLLSVGCYKLQRSTYVYPHECKTEILTIAANLGVSKYVTVYATPNLGNREVTARDFYFDQFKKYKRAKSQKG